MTTPPESAMITAGSPVESLPTDLQTVAEFEQWQRQYAHEGSYEFVRGRIIPKPAMKQDEIFIATFLTRLFTGADAYKQGDELLPEVDSYVDSTRKRVPDLTYFTKEQLTEIRRKERVNTLFAIEILSDFESHQDVLDKIQDYFDGGTQLVWYIVQKQQKIHAYTSPDELKAFKGADMISAAPVVPDFQFVVADLFA